MAKGFGKSDEVKQEKSAGQKERERASSEYDEIAKSGGQEYSIFVRQFGSADDSPDIPSLVEQSGPDYQPSELSTTATSECRLDYDGEGSCSDYGGLDLVSELDSDATQGPAFYVGRLMVCAPRLPKGGARP